MTIFDYYGYFYYYFCVQGGDQQFESSRSDGALVGAVAGTRHEIAGRAAVFLPRGEVCTPGLQRYVHHQNIISSFNANLTDIYLFIQLRSHL